MVVMLKLSCHLLIYIPDAKTQKDLKTQNTVYKIYLQIAKWRIISLFDLFQFVIIPYLEQSFLNIIHFLDFAHNILINSIHDLL